MGISAGSNVNEEPQISTRSEYNYMQRVHGSPPPSLPPSLHGITHNHSIHSRLSLPSGVVALLVGRLVADVGAEKSHKKPTTLTQVLVYSYVFPS